jgi:hypothetical protein
VLELSHVRIARAYTAEERYVTGQKRLLQYETKRI